MKVLCIGPVESEARNEAGTGPAYVHPVTIGTVYTVRAMVLQNNRLGVMVVSKEGWPELVPLELFTVVDGDLPSGWEFATRSGFRSALWGYPTLIRNANHIGDLHIRNSEARDAFLAESGVVGFDEETGKFIE